MVEYLFALAVLALALWLPQTRRTLIETLAVTAIAAVGVAALVLPVVALQQTGSWPGSHRPPPQSAVADGSDRTDALAQERADERHRVEEARRRRVEEERERDEEQARIAGVVEKVRSIVERERRYAAAAASREQLPGVEQLSAELIEIRIPAWRDAALADREKSLIFAWLYALGLTTDETTSIRTANGWGSVYDLWRAENPLLAARPAQPDADAPVGGRQASPVPGAGSGPDGEPRPDIVPPPQPPRAERPTIAVQRATAPRGEPRRESPPPRRPPPPRPPPPEREVGPFGY
jgi:hypothetical protein